MKVSWVVFFAGLCLETLAEELGTEGACTAEDCAVSGSALLQRAAAAGESGPVKEYDEAGKLIDDPTPLKPCDKMKKGKLEKIIEKIEKTISKVSAGIEKCVEKRAALLLRLKGQLEYFKKCIGAGADGAFVEDSVSEEAEGAEDAAYEVEELDEKQNPGELDKSKKKQKPLPPCEKIKRKKAERVIARIEKMLPEVSKKMEACKTKPAGKLAQLNAKLEHFKKCL